jgi:hypothetical protein
LPILGLIFCDAQALLIVFEAQPTPQSACTSGVAL